MLWVWRESGAISPLGPLTDATSFCHIPPQIHAIHAGVLPFRQQFFAATKAAPPPSRWGISQRPENVFRSAAYRNRLWCLMLSMFVRPRAMSCFRVSSALTHLFVMAPTTGRITEAGGEYRLRPVFVWLAGEPIHCHTRLYFHRVLP